MRSDQLFVVTNRHLQSAILCTQNTVSASHSGSATSCHGLHYICIKGNCHCLKIDFRHKDAPCIKYSAMKSNT